MKRFLTFLLLLSLKQSIAQNLVAHYPLNGNAMDVIGNLNGTIQGSPVSIADRFSNPNSALLFDGIDDVISIIGSPINTTTNMSLAFWMFRSNSTLSSEPVLLGVDDCIGGPTLNGYSVYAGGFGPTSAFQGTGLTIAVSNVVFLNSTEVVSGIGQWDFIVAQNNAGTFQLYKNGLLAMSGVASMQAAPTSMRIGSGTNCRFFAGAIDDVQVYDGPLSQSQITALYNLQAPLPLQFMQFDVQSCLQNICLSWQTNSEHNVSQYVIQKSNDGISFDEIGVVASQGNGDNTYNFIDKNTSFHSRSYFRIMSVDIDDSKQFSPVVSIVNKQQSNIVCTPNPAASYIELYNASQVLEVSLHDMTGNRILQSEFKTKIYLPSLPKGMYMLKLKTNLGTEVHKIQIQ